MKNEDLSKQIYQSIYSIFKNQGNMPSVNQLNRLREICDSLSKDIVSAAVSGGKGHANKFLEEIQERIEAGFNKVEKEIKSIKRKVSEIDKRTKGSK